MLESVDAATSVVVESEDSAELQKSEDVCYAFFILDGREFGIKVENVRETIIHSAAYTQMPSSMDALDGLINLRGSIIPIINLRTRFQLEPITYCSESPIAIVQFSSGQFGLQFDEISEVVRVKQGDIIPIATSDDDVEMCNHGVISLDDGQRIIQLLDLERLFMKYNLPLINNETDESRRVFRPRKQDITMMLGDQEYALGVDSIREIIKPPEIKCKIVVDPVIKGVIELREELINIVDLRRYLQYPVKDPGPESRIVILQGQLNCGILVDSIREVIHYEEDQLLPIPPLGTGRQQFLGIVALDSGRNIVKLDAVQLFDDKLLKQLQGNMELHVDSHHIDNQNCEQEDGKCQHLVNKVLISFRLDGNYAFDISLYREIINYNAEIVPLPGMPSFYAGVLNLRNKAIPIINLRKYYGLKDYKDISTAKIIIVNLAEKVFGIMVDDIIEIVKPDRMNIEHIPSMSLAKNDKVNDHIHEGFRFKTLAGEEKNLLIYDVEKLMTDLNMSGEAGVSS